MKTHEVANLFPMLSDKELDNLAEDIKANGQIQPCVKMGDILLDGRNRIAACERVGAKPVFTEYKGDSPVGFIIGVNLKRRHLDKGQKIALALEVEPHFAAEAKKRQGARTDLVEKVPRSSAPTKSTTPPSKRQDGAKSRDQAAFAVGISGKLVSDAKAIREADPERFEKIKQGKLSVAKAKKEIKAERDKKALSDAQKNVDAERRKKIESVCDVRHCSCAELFASGIKPDAVITDPPYPAEFLECFTELAEGSAACGVPLVAVMSGQSYLPDVYRRLCEHLKYRWTLAYMTPGGQAVQQWQAKVNTFWKPVLLFGESRDWFGDVATSKPNDNDKRFHGWGQSEGGMADLVSRLTEPGQLVCDPFVGGGTTAVAALALGRRFVGCDIDEAHVKQTRARVVACK